MSDCPTYAIDYVEREEAFESFNKIKTLEIASEILDRDIKSISKGITNIDNVLVKLLSARFGMKSILLRSNTASDNLSRETGMQGKR